MAYVLEISDMVGYGAGAGPENWTPVSGLFEFTVTRSGPARPGTFEAVYAAPDIPGCGKPASARQRFRLRDNSITTDQNRDIIMVGRLDDVEPVQNDQYGRCYRAKGRDYLGALADNHIAPGVDNVFGSKPDHPCDPQSAEQGAWIANWVGANSDNPYHQILDGGGEGDSLGNGELRLKIIKELALNIVAPYQGIMHVATGTVGPSAAPNSKPIEPNYQDRDDTAILDAIRNLANEDPWSSYTPGVGFYVDGRDVALGAFQAAPGGMGPPAYIPLSDAGIGGEFQIDYYHAGNSPLVCGPLDQRAGHQAIYYRRGADAWDPSIVFQYGGLTMAGGKVYIIPIISYALPELGSEIYSRGTTLGTNTAKYTPPTAPGGYGTGVILPSAEDTWDPVNGLYCTQRDIIGQDEAITGDWVHDLLPDSENYKTRQLRDRTYASIYTGNAGLARYRGAMAGTITVPYFPRNIAGFPLVPGQTIMLRIDHLNIISKAVIADSWSYAWPSNQMTITISRNPMRGLGQQLLKGVRQAEQAIAANANTVDLGWWQTDGTGSHRWVHNRGVIPTSGTAVFAQASGDIDAAGNPIPVDGTELSMPMGLTYDPFSGQYVGWTWTELNANAVTIQYAPNSAVAPGPAGWLMDGTAIMRVILSR
jgi:hypothetical protein